MRLHYTFTYQGFSCDVALLEDAEVVDYEEDSEYSNFYMRQEKLYMARFYTRSKEPKAEKISDYVSVNPGYGYLSFQLKTVEISTYNEDNVLSKQCKQGGGLISGFLDERVFTSEEMVKAAVYFLIDIVGDVGYYYSISLVKTTNFVEYNGEY